MFFEYQLNGKSVPGFRGVYDGLSVLAYRAELNGKRWWVAKIRYQEHGRNWVVNGFGKTVYQAVKEVLERYHARNTTDIDDDELQAEADYFEAMRFDD